MDKSIRHTGIVDKVEADIIYVRIIQRSACSGCHANAMCPASESKNKIVEVTDCSGLYKEGDEVVLTGQSSMGLLAVFIAFVVPLVIILTTVFTGTYLSYDEAISGLAGIVLLFPYYSILYLLRNKLKKRFIFTLEKH